MPLTGRVALVTGGSRGIGRAIALYLADAGATVAITYRRNQDAAEKVVKEISLSGESAVSAPLELEDRESIRGALARVQSACGPVEILVNNAAIAQEKPFETIRDEDWDRMLAVNLRGAFALCQEVLPAMLEREWGRIINITSIGGQWGGFNQVHYAAAKAGLISLTQSMAKIYSKHGITSNAVSPGLVATDMASAELDSDAGKEKVRNIPLGRICSPFEVADAVAFLARDEAGAITGQTVNVNGGMYFG